MFKNIFSKKSDFGYSLKKLKEKKESTQPKKTRIKSLKYIPRVLSKVEKILILICFVLILGSLIYMGVIAYPKYIQKKPAYGGDYTEGVVGQPQFLNPILAPVSDSDSDITKLIYSSLLTYDEKQELVLDLAENYEISEDQKNYTFYIKQGIKWHDGEEVNADDIVFTVQAIKNPEYQSPLRASFSGVAVEKIDDYTIKFTLTGDTFSPFLKENTTFGILPQHIWQEVPVKNITLSDYNLQPIGSGPYKFKEYKKDKQTSLVNSYSLVAFKDYFDKKPYIEEINFKFYDDYSRLIAAYNKKEVQGISYIPRDEKDNIKKDINQYLLKLPRYYAIFFNEAKNEILADKNVRKALAYAIDRERIINEAIGGEGILIDTPIPSGFLGHNPEVEKYNYDTEKSISILEEEGWEYPETNEESNEEETEDNKIRSNDGDDLEITLTHTSQSEFSQIAQIIAENWQAVGVKVNIQETDATILQSEYIRTRNYEALIYGQLISHDPDPYPFWHSSQREDPGLNLTSFKNVSANNLLEEARKTSDEEERIKKYLHFQNIVADEVPAILLYSPTYLYGVNPKVKGIELEYITVPSDRFADIKNWYIKIDRYWKKSE